MTSETLPPKETSSPFLRKFSKLRRRYSKPLLISGAVGLLLLVSVPTVIPRLSKQNSLEQESSQALAGETLTTEPVTSYEVARTYTGEITAVRTSNIGFERGGELIQVLVEEGDLVTSGQPLASLDTSNLETQRQQLQAEKARAEAQLVELEAGPRREDIQAAQAVVQDIEEQLKLQEVQRSRREFLYKEGAIAPTAFSPQN